MSTNAWISILALTVGGLVFSAMVGYFVTGMTLVFHRAVEPREGAAKAPPLRIIDHGIPCVAVVILFAGWWSRHAFSLASVIALLVVLCPRALPLARAVSEL